MKKPASESNSQIKPLRKSTCPALSGKSTLSYSISQDTKKALYIAVTANDGGGFFSTERVPWSDIEVAIHADEPVTSICLRSLFQGKSVNTSGFLLAVLVSEDILESMPKKVRHFQVTGKSLLAGKTAPRKTPAKKKAPAKKARKKPA